MNTKSAWAGILLMIIMLLAGCGASTSGGEKGSSEDLQAYSQQLTALNEVYAPFGVQPRSVYSEDGKVYLEVFNAQKPWQTLSADEMKKLEQAIYDALGDPFPLHIQSFALPEQADITGEITALDGNRVLIVDDKDSDNKIPHAMWVQFPSNTLGGLKIGYQVNAWSNGITADSYPGQTSGVQIQVVKFDVSNGDLQGTVTALHLEDQDESNRYVEIDGHKHHLFPFTLYWINDMQAQAGDIQLGDKVEAWFPGYQVTDENFISQLRIIK